MKVVKVLWVDSCNSNLNWTVAEDIEVKLMWIDSFGVVVKDTDEFLAIAQNYNSIPEHYSNIMTIPKGCIKEVFVIHEDNEQNLADKVEPKFKVGDWITDGKALLYITKYESDYGYELKATDGQIFHFVSPDFVDANYHLWTIKDAKEGDVLYLQHDGKEHIIIYKGIIKERFRTFVSAYCAYNGIVDAFCFADVSKYGDIAYGVIMPSTKEQRDLLFAKMKEAGYEWDADKKELKKNHLCQDDNIKWSDTDKLLMRLDKIVDCNIDQLKCLNNIFDKLNEVIGN